jgi:predicted dithiol-disulfide oxidoreductase (DUF899 family)
MQSVQQSGWTLRFVSSLSSIQFFDFCVFFVSQSSCTVGFRFFSAGQALQQSRVAGSASTVCDLWPNGNGAS